MKPIGLAFTVAKKRIHWLGLPGWRFCKCGLGFKPIDDPNRDECLSCSFESRGKWTVGEEEFDNRIKKGTL